MRKILESCIIAFSMYSKIPMPRIDWTKENMKYAMCFFPLVGAAVGAAVWAWCYSFPLVGVSQVLGTVVAILLPIVITGGIHLDGLLDTADALSSYQPMEKKLEILKDSNCGAFAVIVCVCYFFLDYGIWYELPLDSVLILAPGYVLCRALSGLAVVSFRCAKNSGLAATFSDMAHRGAVRRVMYFYILLSGAAMIALDPVRGAAGVVCAFGVFGYYRLMSYRKFGGITGDLAGFFVQVCELAMAVCMVVLEKIH